MIKKLLAIALLMLYASPVMAVGDLVVRSIVPPASAEYAYMYYGVQTAANSTWGGSATNPTTAYFPITTNFNGTVEGFTTGKFSGSDASERNVALYNSDVSTLLQLGTFTGITTQTEITVSDGYYAAAGNYNIAITTLGSGELGRNITSTCYYDSGVACPNSSLANDGTYAVLAKVAVKMKILASNITGGLLGEFGGFPTESASENTEKKYFASYYPAGTFISGSINKIKNQIISGCASGNIGIYEVNGTTANLLVDGTLGVINNGTAFSFDSPIVLDKTKDYIVVAANNNDTGYSSFVYPSSSVSIKRFTGTFGSVGNAMEATIDLSGVSYTTGSAYGFYCYSG